jgi:hypothetical protein
LRKWAAQQSGTGFCPKETLRSDYQAYRQHIAFSGCGPLELRDGYIFADVSQLHVGGYTSFIFIHSNDATTYVFWLKGTVRDKEWELYGPKPVPDAVLHTVEAELNTAASATGIDRPR